MSKKDDIYERDRIMTDMKWIVAGRTFRTQRDYAAGCRDKKKIDQIRKKIDFKDKQAVLKLQEVLKKGNFRFETILGQDFIEEVNELTDELEGKVQSKKSSKISLDEYDEELKKEIVRVLKKKELIRKIQLGVLTIVATTSLGYFTYYYYTTYKSSDEFANLSELKDDKRLDFGREAGQAITKEQKPILKKYQTLYNKNKKLIGWVKIADTNIDYPVMQSSNEDYYLDHNYNQEKDKNGSIFMDAKCDAMAPSTNLIIYGHNMRSGKMFGSLSKYEDEEYYKKHKRIIFDTIYQEGKYEVMYAFRARLYEETEIVFKYYQFIDAYSEEEFNSNMKEMAAMSLYDTGVTASYGDQLLTLSTCDNNEKNGRFVVVAKRIE